MELSNKILIVQTILMLFTLIAAASAALLAFYIGLRQNNINQQTLDTQNFVETFVMPQQVLGKDRDGNQILLNWNLLIKNASIYPIYIKSYTLNGVKKMVGSQALPANNMDAWYGVFIPPDVQEKNNISLLIEFDDYLGNHYKSEHYAIYTGISWEVTSQKKELVYRVK